MSQRAIVWLVTVVFALVGVAFALHVPAGEAPDEPAHFRYARFVSRNHQLPPQGSIRSLDYEAHQPPLDYIADAIVLSLGGADTVEFTPNPGFDSHRAGSRAFDITSTTRASLNAFRIVRLLHVVWGVIALMILFTGVRLFALSRETFAIASSVLLVPQFIFICSVINNDALLVVFSSAAILALVRFVDAPTVRGGLIAALLIAAALFSKGSALFLLVPAAVAALIALRVQARVAAAALLLGAWTALLLFFGLNMWRFGTAMPPVPSTTDVVARSQWFVTRPSWVVTAFRSFWAKFGVMNTALPLATYAWFALLTLLVAFGAFKALRRLGPRNLVLVSAAAANVALLCAFMLRVDWQPQGRYLFPSLLPIACSASFAAEGLPHSWKRALAFVVPLGNAAVALFSAVYVTLAYS